jgi:hypothetical protein
LGGLIASQKGVYAFTEHTVWIIISGREKRLTHCAALKGLMDMPFYFKPRKNEFFGFGIIC